MTTSSASGYGVYNPNAADPSQVENSLADIVGRNNPTDAANLLRQYQAAREAATGNYDYAMRGQHDFARQQLAATMHENNLKALQEGYKTPGLLGAYNSPQYADIIAGIDPAQMLNASTNLQHAQDVESAQKGGAAAASLTTAGAQPQQQGMDYLSGGTAGPVGIPLQLQVGREANAARMAAARIRGSSAPGPSMTYKIDTDRGPANITLPGKMSPQQRESTLDELGVPKINAGPTAPAALPDEGRRNQSTGGTQTTSAAPSTRLTPAPQNEVPGKAEFQTKLAAHIEAYKDRPWYADVKAGMSQNNGKALVAPDGKGGWRPQGASGTVY